MQAPPEDHNPINRAYEAWAARTPVVCRCLCVGLAACYGFSWILDLQRGLEVVPFRIVRRLELWRLVLSPCVGNSLLGTVVALFVLGDGVGPRLEQSWGSMRMMIATLTASVVINVSFCGLCYLFTMMIGSAEPALASMSGGWPLLLCLITIECLSSPDGTRPLPCIPIQVPRDRYPAALLLLLIILGAPKLALSLGCAYGYAYAKGYLEVLKPKPALVARCENASALACVTSDSTFVSAERSLGASAFTVSGGDWADPENPSTSVQRGFGEMIQTARAEWAATRTDIPPPGGQGRVLGAAAPAAAPLVPAARPPPSPQRTAAANREAILAAAERRSRQQNAGS